MYLFERDPSRAQDPVIFQQLMHGLRQLVPWRRRNTRRKQELRRVNAAIVRLSMRQAVLRDELAQTRRDTAAWRELAERLRNPDLVAEVHEMLLALEAMHCSPNPHDEQAIEMVQKALGAFKCLQGMSDYQPASAALLDRALDLLRVVDQDNRTRPVPSNQAANISEFMRRPDVARRLRA